MKKVFALMGSRRKDGNTAYFVQQIIERLDSEEFTVEYGFPQDYSIKPCLGCNRCFSTCKCVQNDELEALAQKILESDALIIASPVYMHYFSGELKCLIDKLSWWGHTFRLQGKPVVLISTCDSNGNNTVIKPLGEIMSFMGGNVIAASNAVMILNQIGNPVWTDDVCSEIANRIKKYAYMKPRSNKEIEGVFKNLREIMKYRLHVGSEEQNMELEFWKKTGMLEYDTFEEYLQDTM